MASGTRATDHVGRNTSGVDSVRRRLFTDRLFRRLRPALQSFRSVVAAGAPATTASYLHLLPDKNWLPPELSPISRNAECAALLVHKSAQTIGEPDTSATVTQRVSRAVTEAFVAARVGEMIQGVGNTLKLREADIIEKVYLLPVVGTLDSIILQHSANVPMVESVLVESGDKCVPLLHL
ncbi:hypothetical protein GGX14DRAFT_570302 [Mycena pura]|uniref:Uncharacterized protein n=1 Tax=Mycena pura TaxID=153505 RepID=A0AAD6V549_9AGAR|nr:hypothetical protein GGX14DRAFT_570302 [Mycena pura]